MDQYLFRVRTLAADSTLDEKLVAADSTLDEKLVTFSAVNGVLSALRIIMAPLRTPGGGGYDENTSSLSPACHNRLLNGSVSRNSRIQRVAPYRCRTGTLKNHTKCLWRWEPEPL